MCSIYRKFTDQWNVYWFGKGIIPDRANRLEDVQLRFYNGTTIDEYIIIPLSESTRLSELKGFKKDNPFVFYTHGYCESTESKSLQVMVRAHLEARPDTNVVVLDWSNMALGSYAWNAGINVKKVGAAAAEQLNRLIGLGIIKLENIHIIAHSLGTHVAGYVARTLKNKYHQTVKRLTAVDPSLVYFYPSAVLKHVNAKDADFVDIIHTDAGGYGTSRWTGTVSFFPNGGGGPQPGCSKSPFLLDYFPVTNPKMSSHRRSWWFYAESLHNPKAFPASPAKSYKEFLKNPTPEVGMVYMGADCDPSARGSFYLLTNSNAPYGRGLGGIYPNGSYKQSINNL